VLSILLLCGISAAAGALEVNKQELESAGSFDSIVFQNYTGPHVKIDSAAAITAIGSGLGSSVAAKSGGYTAAGDQNRYYVIHAVDPAVKEKLDADILILGANAAVDHIDNVRRIIAGYLSAAYGYSSSDSATIAKFVTVYNAVYRGNLEVFKQKYKDAVTKHLTKEKAGIALKYQEWPGNTQLVIPLADLSGGALGTIDTSVISDKNVVESLRSEEGKALEERKNMVDLKEREADAASEKAQAAQQEAAYQQSQARAQQEAAEKALQEAEESARKAQEAAAQAEKARQEAQEAAEKAQQAQKEAEEAAQKAAAAPGNADNAKAAQEAAARSAEEQRLAQEKQQQAADQEKAADEARKASEEKQQQADAEKQLADELAKKAEEAKKHADEAEEKAEQKMSEAASDRTSIAKDQQQLIAEEKQNAASPSVEGMVLTDEAKLLSGIVRVNADTGKVIKTSPVTVIRNRTMYDTGSSFIAIAGETGDNKAVKLVLLDKTNLEIVKESIETIAPESVLIQNGSTYYCIVQDGSNNVLASYQSDLTLIRRSSVPLNASSPVTVTPNGIVVTGSDNAVKILSPDTLAETAR